MSTQEQRGYQMFPVLDAARVETALRFASGPERQFAPGEIVYDHGQWDTPSWLVLSGSIDISRRDGLDRTAPIVTFGPGQFTGEVNQLAGHPAITCARAGKQGATAKPFDAAHLRALMIGSAEIGETVMRALILRRVDLIAPPPRRAAAAGSDDVALPDRPHPRAAQCHHPCRQ
jgi:thioredoxin reductase (NADPH)